MPSIWTYTIQDDWLVREPAVSTSRVGPSKSHIIGLLGPLCRLIATDLMCTNSFCITMRFFCGCLLEIVLIRGIILQAFFLNITLTHEIVSTNILNANVSDGDVYISKRDSFYYISSIEGHHFGTIVCNVTQSGAFYQTNWYIERPFIDSSFKHIGVSISSGKVSYPADLVDKVIIYGPLLVQGTNITYQNHFLISNFTREFHMAELQCGSLNVRSTFFLGIRGTWYMYVCALYSASVYMHAYRLSGHNALQQQSARVQILPIINIMLQHTNWSFIQHGACSVPPAC